MTQSKLATPVPPVELLAKLAGVLSEDTVLPTAGAAIGAYKYGKRMSVVPLRRRLGDVPADILRRKAVKRGIVLGGLLGAVAGYGVLKAKKALVGSAPSETRIVY